MGVAVPDEHFEMAPPVGIPETDHAKENEDSLEQDEIRVREEENAMLIIENPAEFERRLVDGELDEYIEEDGDEPDESDEVVAAHA